MARRKDRLDALAAELFRTYGTTSKVVALDLLTSGAVDDLWQQVADLDVGIVVVAAGVYFGGALVAHPLTAELDVLVVSPGQTRTEGLAEAAGIDFGKIPGTKMASSRVARTALRSLGRRAHVIPGHEQVGQGFLFVVGPERAPLPSWASSSPMP